MEVGFVIPDHENPILHISFVYHLYTKHILHRFTHLHLRLLSNGVHSNGCLDANKGRDSRRMGGGGWDIILYIFHKFAFAHYWANSYS
jgi:hypothetical protein